MSDIKKRAINFSFKEEKTLLALIKKYASSIECKKTDVNSNRLKAAAYEKLAVEYNSICGEHYRDAKTLKGKYENLKKSAKKKFSNDRAYLRGTGGGPAVASTSNESSELNVDLQEILGHRMTGFNSEFDGDSTLEIPELIATNDQSGIVLTTIEGSDLVVDWSEYSPDMLRSRTSSALKPVSTQTTINDISNNEKNMDNMNNDGKVNVNEDECFDVLNDRNTIIKNNNAQKEGKGRKRNRPLQDKLSMWASSKTEMVELQESLMQKEHDLKLELMKSCHQHTIDVEKRESDLKIKLMREKHAKEMELLELKIETMKHNLKQSTN